MTLKKNLGISAAILLAGFNVLPLASYAATAKLDIDLANPGHAIPPTFNGFMTEEINHAYDGGLYAELIQNRTFQDPAPGSDSPAPPSVPNHWSIVGSGKLSITKSNPVNRALPVSLRLELSGQTSGVANDGYWGIPIHPDTKYTASFYAKGGDGFAGPVTAAMVTDQGVTVAEAKTEPVTGEWKKYTLTLTTGHDTPSTAEARFVLSGSGNGSIFFSLVSLFPPTYQNAANGLRPDLMKLMADMHPAFIRLPGGNYLEGGRFSDRFNWKKMIGPVDQRPGHQGCWGYRSSDGFGLPEYLLWCKQLGAEPVLAVFAGYTLNGDHVDAGSPELAIYTQEALDEIEYVTGSATSKWGKLRVADGFPEPFPLHYVEIGNEDFFDKSGSYDGRFTEIAKAIRKKYPHLKIIATDKVTSFKPDLYDDHMYAGAAQTMAQFNRYDQQSAGSSNSDGRKPDGIKTFVGEWATQGGKPTPNLRSALADAVFLMGLEKNSDEVVMQCYAPLFANANRENKAKGLPRGWQWDTNLLGYDALGSYGSPSYWIQALCAQHKGNVVLPTKLDVPPVVKPLDAAPSGSIGVGSWNTQVEYKDIEVTSPDGKKLSGDDLIKNSKLWQITGEDWVFNGETMKVQGEKPTSIAIAGDRNWKDYTIRLRARKLGGEEGFLVMWHAANDENYRWWNIGGWNNTITRCEAAVDGSRSGYGASAPFNVETGRWYNLRLEVSGHQIHGYIDDKLVLEATDEQNPAVNTPKAFASSTYMTENHDVIVKVVNAGSQPLETDINLQGAGKVGPNGTAFVIMGELQDVNSIEEPTKVAVKEEAITNVSAAFKHTFPPHSFTLLKFPATQQK